jgi:hypothetical protein
MAAKPTSTPRWANLGGLIVEPSSGKKDVGWVDAEKPAAESFNWYQNLAWQWTQYLSDGVLRGPLRVSNGPTTIGSNPSLNQPGDLAVDRNLGVAGSLTVDLGANFAADIEVDGNIQGNTDVSGNRFFFSTEQDYPFPASLGKSTADTCIYSRSDHGFVNFSATPAEVIIPLSLPSWYLIRRLSVGYKTTVSSGTRTFTLVRTTPNGVGVTLRSFNSAALGTFVRSLTITPPVFVDAYAWYTMEMTILQGDCVFGATVACNFLQDVSTGTHPFT